MGRHLADAQRGGRLDEELARLQRIPLLVLDEVGYIPRRLARDPEVLSRARLHSPRTPEVTGAST
jgi:DNA replication protein DnaC